MSISTKLQLHIDQNFFAFNFKLGYFTFNICYCISVNKLLFVFLYLSKRIAPFFSFLFTFFYFTTGKYPCDSLVFFFELFY